MKQERIIYEEQPFYSLERVPKPRENGFGTRYLVKLAVAGAVRSDSCWEVFSYAKEIAIHHNINVVDLEVTCTESMCTYPS